MAAKNRTAGTTPKLVATAEEAERELQEVVDAATVAGNWQPVQAAECRRLAGDVIEARTAENTSYEPGANLARWL